MNNPEKKSNNKKFFKENSMNEEEKKEIIKNLDSLKDEKIENLKLQLLKNQKKINDIELRQLANIENIKKNTEQKIKNIKNIEMEKFLRKIIPIIDALEEVLTLSSTFNTQDKPLIEGIELTLQSLLNILLKIGVKIEGKKNELFNPEIHTPIFIESSQKELPNHVISIVKKGFTFNQVLLRKAIVTILKN